MTESGGIEQFTDTQSTIWASGHDRDFIGGPGRLPVSSLCRFVGMETPEYRVTNWAGDGQPLVDAEGHRLGLTLYQTPGHTPDQLAIWDPQERFLFVGDTIYEWSAILFPPEGSNVTAFSATVGKLRKLVHEWNSMKVAQPSGDQHLASRVKMACGHITQDADAAELIAEVDQVLWDLVEGRIQPTDGGIKRGERMELYRGPGARVSFLGSHANFAALKHSPQVIEEMKRRRAEDS